MSLPPGAIQREWTALVESARVDEYLTHMRDAYYDRYVAVDGNLRTDIHHRELGDARSEVRVLSLWRDEAAIRAVVGDDLHRPLTYPDDDEYLLEPARPVRHWSMRVAQGSGRVSSDAVVREAIAVVETVRVDEFVVHMRATRHDDYSQAPGVLRSSIATRALEDGRSEIRVASVWDDEASIRRLVGDDLSVALSYPEDGDYLLEMPRRVLHWRVR